MRSTDWDLVMNHMDESYLQDALSSKGTVMTQKMDFEKENAMRDHKTTLRFGRGLLAAAVVAAMVTCVAFAANFFGIQEMFSRSGRQFPNDAAADIQRHQVKGDGAGWACAVTESLSDASTVMVSITVTSEDEYVLVPTDAQPDDPAADIGLAGDGTLADYAAERGKKLLMVGAGIGNAEDLGIDSASLSFENVSDGELVILINAKKNASAAAIDAVCTVTAVEADSGAVQRVELPFTLKESTAEDTVYLAADGQTISGLEFGEARVEETSLGLNLEIPVKALDEDALRDIMKIDFAGLAYDEGGFVLGDDGTWTGKYPMCRGDIDGELRALVYDWDNQLLGEIVFNQQ